MIDRSIEIVSFALAVSYNQPILCPNALWNPNAITFATQAIIGSNPHVVFATRKDIVVAPHRSNGQVLIWNNGTVDPITIVTGLTNPLSVFVTNDEQIFVDNGATNGQVDRWTLNGTRLSSYFFLCSQCFGLFVDVNNHLYCSAYDRHQVLRQSLTYPSSGLIIMAGNGCSGSTVEMLNGPFGIFVTIDLDLYVADFFNDRVQLFREGQRNGKTVVGTGSSGTIGLRRPTGVVVDGDGYLFIVDQWNHRIVGSDQNGFRCLAGCSRTSDPGSSLLNNPRSMSFDVDGNIFVTDYANHRIQKFLLTNNSCSKSTTVTD